MKKIRYSKYVPDPAGEMSMEDLLNALSDYLLQSGFQTSYGMYDMRDMEQTIEQLKKAIEQALLNGELFDQEMQQQIEGMYMEGKLDELIEQIIQRMQQENYVTIDQPHDPSDKPSVGGQVGQNEAQVKFEITDKSLDF